VGHWDALPLFLSGFSPEQIGTEHVVAVFKNVSRDVNGLVDDPFSWVASVFDERGEIRNNNASWAILEGSHKGITLSSFGFTIDLSSCSPSLFYVPFDTRNSEDSLTDAPAERLLFGAVLLVAAVYRSSRLRGPALVVASKGALAS
jgi:hypothetical protein